MSKILHVVICLALVAAFGLSVQPVDAAVKKAVKKTVKKAPKRVVLGTQQLKGDQAKIGVAYTLGKRDPLNVTLKKVEYSVEPLRMGNTIISLSANEKFLILHYTLHNPNPRNRGLAWSTFDIQAIDAKDTNWRYVTDVAMEGTGESCNMSLKPAQKTNVYTAIKVPASGEIPKIMFQTSDKLVLRYDIRGKAVGLPAPIADPADATKATALEAVPAEMGVFYPLRELHCKIESAAYSTEQFNNRPPRKGERYLIVTGTMKNNLFQKRSVSWNTIKPEFTDVDGGSIRAGDETYYASRDEGIRAEIEPGKEIRFRWVVQVPEKVAVKTMAVSQNNGRKFVYDLSQIQ